MPNIRFYQVQISWRNIFSVSSLYQGQRQFSLPENFSDYNNIVITMKKDVAQPYHISVKPKKSLLKNTAFSENLQKVIGDFFEDFNVSSGTTTSAKKLEIPQFLCH